MLAGARERILKALSCSGKDGREEEEEKGGTHDRAIKGEEGEEESLPSCH